MLTLVLFGWFLWPFLGNGARFPVGPDGPVYLWWTRLAGLEGLSAIGHRPGAPALALVLSGTLGRSVVEVTAALEVVLGVATGTAAVAMLRRRATSTGSLLGGLLAGTFAVHLAAGYLANLAFMPAFLAAGAVLDEERGTGTSVLAAGMLGAGGLSHPLFFALGALVLVLAAADSWRTDRAAARRLGAATIGGGALVGAGLLALLAGPRPPEVDTSKDAFLRRASLLTELRSAYRDRFVLRWARYVQWVSVPLALVGLGPGATTMHRILRAWFLVTVVGVMFGLITGLLPPDRFVTFGFAVPLLAALGLERLRSRLHARRLIGWTLIGGLTLLMLAGSAIAWNRQRPFLSPDEVRAVTEANAAVSTIDRDVPLAFSVNEPDDTIGFLVARAANVIRAAMPPDRIRDVVVFVPPREGAAGAERRALEALTADDLARAQARLGTEAEVFVLAPFDAVDRPTPLATGSLATDPLRPAGAGAIAWTSFGSLALFWIVGFGWARLGLSDRISAAAAAPSFGIGATILLAVALDLLGVRVGSTAGAWITSGLAGGSGYLAWLLVQRTARARPSS